MKKTGAILLSIVLSIYLISIVYANTIPTQGLQDQYNSAQQTAANLQQTPDQIRNQYLSQEWGKEVAKIPVIGQIHTFFTNNPIIFEVIFNIPYSFSLTFFLTIFLWLLILVFSYNIFKAYMKEKWAALLIGIGIAIIAAQSTIINIIVTAALQLIFAQSLWWVRAIIWIALFFVIMIFYYLDHMLSKKIRANRIAKEKADLKQDVAETKAFVKGVKEGLKIKGK